jgi:hypothetical protein
MRKGKKGLYVRKDVFNNNIERHAAARPAEARRAAE